MANKTGIDWCNYTLNPIFGCANNCDSGKWCYARKLAQRGLSGCLQCKAFEVHFHPERLADPIFRRKKPAVVFLDSMSDFWSPGVEQSWRDACIQAMGGAPQHQFVVLTKRPDRITQDDMLWWPPNAWIGVSVT